MTPVPSAAGRAGRMGARARRGASGFTLLELLVALSIFAVISVMTYGGLMSVLEQREVADAQAERWRAVQLAVRMVTRDLQQIHPRPVRDEIGDIYQPAVLAGNGGEYALQLTRGGWTNPAGHPRSSLQRVAYRLDEQGLMRVHWPVLDRTPAAVPVATELLDGVESLQIRMLDWAGEWHEQWPPPASDPVESLQRVPRAVELVLLLEDLGRIERLVVSAP